MTNNDILRRIRSTFGFGDEQISAVFALGGDHPTLDEIGLWLKRDDDPNFAPLQDVRLAKFLNGLIVHRRGEREGPKPVAEQRLNNNIVLRKLKIALDFKNEDILRVMTLAGFPIGNSELTALFRKPGHRNYRACQDQLLRNFLNGMYLEHHPEAAAEP